jgi:hypothetical protein
MHPINLLSHVASSSSSLLKLFPTIVVHPWAWDLSPQPMILSSIWEKVWGDLDPHFDQTKSSLCEW